MSMRDGHPFTSVRGDGSDVALRAEALIRSIG
jgi:hypothetical protein